MGYIVKIKDFHSAFEQAHALLLRDLNNQGIGRIGFDKLTSLWESHYNQKIISDANWGQWVAIDFLSHEAYTMFLLKYSR